MEDPLTPLKADSLAQNLPRLVLERYLQVEVLVEISPEGLLGILLVCPLPEPLRRSVQGRDGKWKRVYERLCQF